LKRLLALLVLLAIGAVAIYYWKNKPASAERAAQGAAAEARQALDTVGQKLKETKYTGSVKAAFELNRELAPLSIDIDSTEDGVVTLKGSVPSEDLKALAGRVAASVPGVTQVNSQLVVGAAPAPAAGGDRVGRVQQALHANSSLSAYAITVREEGGRVVLSGRVRTAAEKDLAGLLARDAAGGTVDNKLSVGP
jgi:osmotically-inducible protein OsmY